MCCSLEKINFIKCNKCSIIFNFKRISLEDEYNISDKYLLYYIKQFLKIY